MLECCVHSQGHSDHNKIKVFVWVRACIIKITMTVLPISSCLTQSYSLLFMLCLSHTVCCSRCALLSHTLCCSCCSPTLCCPCCVSLSCSFCCCCFCFSPTGCGSCCVLLSPTLVVNVISYSGHTLSCSCYILLSPNLCCVCLTRPYSLFFQLCVAQSFSLCPSNIVCCWCCMSLFWPILCCSPGVSVFRRMGRWWPSRSSRTAKVDIHIWNQF